MAGGEKFKCVFSCKSAGSWPLPFTMKPGLLRILVHLNSFPWLFRGNWPSLRPQAHIQSAFEGLERKQKICFLSLKKIQNYLFSACSLRCLFRCLMQNFSSLAHILYKQDFLPKTLLKIFLEQLAFIL